jgi:hypothetical protein
MTSVSSPSPAAAKLLSLITILRSESDMRSGSVIVTQQPDTHRVCAVGQWTGALLEGGLQACTATQDVPSQDTALI